MIQAMAQGVGIGLLPCYIGDTVPGLALVSTIEGGLPVDIWLVTASANKKRSKVQAFFKFFADKNPYRMPSRFGGQPYELVQG